MTTTSDGAEDARSSTLSATVKQTIAAMFEGSGLEVHEVDNGLVIVNPQDLERGQVHIAYAECYVSWERVTWDYLGVLEGFGEDDDETTTVTKIIDTLTSNQ